MTSAARATIPDMTIRATPYDAGDLVWWLGELWHVSETPPSLSPGAVVLARHEVTEVVPHAELELVRPALWRPGDYVSREGVVDGRIADEIGRIRAVYPGGGAVCEASGNVLSYLGSPERSAWTIHSRAAVHVHQHRMIF